MTAMAAPAVARIRRETVRQLLSAGLVLTQDR